MAARCRTTLGAVWLALVAGIAGAGGAAAQLPRPAPADTLEAILIELRLDRLASRTVPAFRVDGTALVPLTQLFDLAEVGYRLSPDGRLEATLEPGDRRLVVDAQTDTLRFGERRVPVAPHATLFRNGELYVAAQPLGALLGSPVVVDFSELTVTLADPSDLPLARRLHREAAHAALLRRARAIQPDLVLGYQRPSWDGLVFDYSVLTPSGQPLAGSAYTGALGADLIGGSLELAASSVGPAGDGVVRIDGSWTGVWRDSPWLEQLRIGDGTSTGPEPRSLRGITLSNAPFVRPSVVGLERFAAALAAEPGWSVEAYRSGQLVAFDSADASGRFALELPVRYGENPVDFVAYGPLGQVRELHQTFRVIDQLLPAGRFEYGVAAGGCRTSQCQATANVDLRYGATARWTAQAGLDQFWRDTLPALFHPYAALAGSLTNAWALTLDATAAALAHGGVRYEPTLDLRFMADYTRYAEGTVAPILTPPGARSRLLLFGFWRPLRRSGFFYFDANLDRLASATGTTTSARLEGSSEGQALRLLPYLRLEHDAVLATPIATHWFGGVNVFALPRRALSPILGPLWLRAGVELGLDGATRLTAYSFTAARDVGHALRVEAGASWVRDGVGPVLTLTLTSYFSAARSYTTLTSVGGSVSGTQYVQGSLLWDRASGRLVTAPGPALERSGVSGRVFLDENGNGVWDRGEPGVAGVRVRVGANTAVSDANGEFRVWDVVPFEPVIVEVDSLSLPSPLMVPAFGSALLEPGPNRFRGLDIPLVRAGVIEGSVVREITGRREGVAGVPLVLTNRRSGARRTLTTFSDGGFYALGVTPGDYELAIEPRALAALHAAAEPLRFAVRAGPSGVGASGLELRLTPSP